LSGARRANVTGFGAALPMLVQSSTEKQVIGWMSRWIANFGEATLRRNWSGCRCNRSEALHGNAIAAKQS
jgi:hypothetical protein